MLCCELCYINRLPVLYTQCAVRTVHLTGPWPYSLGLGAQQCSNMHFSLTEPRWPLQPRGTQWFLRIGLFVVRAISLGPCRRPIEYLTSSHPCGRLSKIPNSQIHKVKKWKILSNFRQKDFFVISHERKDRFFVVIWPKKTLRHIKYLPRIDSTKVGHF